MRHEIKYGRALPLKLRSSMKCAGESETILGDIFLNFNVHKNPIAEQSWFKMETFLN